MAQQGITEGAKLEAGSPRGILWLVRRAAPVPGRSTEPAAEFAGPVPADLAEPTRVRGGAQGAAPAHEVQGGAPAHSTPGMTSEEGEARQGTGSMGLLAPEGVAFSTLQELIDLCSAHSGTAAFLRVELHAVTGGKNRRLVLDFGQFSDWH